VDSHRGVDLVYSISVASVACRTIIRQRVKGPGSDVISVVLKLQGGLLSAICVSHYILVY